MKLILNFSLFLILIVSVSTEAHIRLNNPVGRMGASDAAKFIQPNAANPTVPDSPGVCANFNTPMAARLQYTAGQVLNFALTETINHPGRFIVQFSPDSVNGFWVAANQLANVADTMSGGNRSINVVIPATPCTNCMLRVLQQMDDQPSEFYVHCFDIAITAAVTPPPGGGSSSSSGGTSTSQSTSNVTSQPKFGGGCGLVKNQDHNGPGGSGFLFLLLLPGMMYLVLRKFEKRCSLS